MLIERGIDEISRVELGVYYEPVSGDKYIYGSLQDYKKNIDVKLARIKSEIGERMALYDWADLVDFWTDAKAKIDKIKTDVQLKKDEKSTSKTATSFKIGQHTYKVLKKGSTVAFTKTKSTAKSISVPATITYGGIKYKVTEVSGNAFKNNRKVTTVKLGSNITTIGVSAFQDCKKLKSVGKKAFSGIYAKAKVKVPSGKKKAYKKLLKGKGLNKKAKIA